jgi:citrate synthase
MSLLDPSCGDIALARAVKPQGAALTLFAIGSTIGWIGHAIEQCGRAELIRAGKIYREWIWMGRRFGE